MALIRRRYTTVDTSTDYLVSISWDDASLSKVQWFEAQVGALNEATGEKVKFPPYISLYRVGEIEHTFKQYVAIDFDGDTEAALNHIVGTISRRVYQFLERGH